jgi:hypothetical protein
LIPVAFYARISADGVGAWVPTAAPPSLTNACISTSGYAYCFGGGDCAPRPQTDCYSPSYYASLTASGIGSWKETTKLPTSFSATHASAGSYIYYLSTPVFFASVSADGIGPWETTTNYPDFSYPDACFSNGTNLYCSSPAASTSYFARIGAPNPKALRLENPPPFPRAEYLGPAWAHGGGGSVTINGVFSGSPNFYLDINDAVVFDCASQAATSAGCKKTVVSPENTMYNYDLTIWYPCTTQGAANTNCCYLSTGDNAPSDAWCISIGSDSFIISDEIFIQ